MAKLDTYSGPWTYREAAHLLRRVCFGATKETIQKVVEDGLISTVDQALAEQPPPAYPVDPSTGEQYIPGKVNFSRNANYYDRLTKAWWAGLLYMQPVSVREKMILMWSNHFAMEMQPVQQAEATFQLLEYIRENALGSMKAMARQISIEAGMLRYLNGNLNTKGSPNENYARELQELFTIGKGKEVAPGDYSTYTEQDVREAARVLTGWRDYRNQGTGTVTIFSPGMHDTGDKHFSARYQNTVIRGRGGAGAGEAELDDLIAMIFRQDETARRYIRVIYRWFVRSEINETIEIEIIEPLAVMLRNNDYVVEPVMRKLLSSQHFFDVDMIASQIKSPADFVIGTLRTTGLVPPPNAGSRNQMFDAMVNSMASQQMDLGDPPNVAGWEALYQAPGYDKLWLSTATLPLRNGFTDSLMANMRGLGKPAINTIEVVSKISNASDAFLLIDALNEIYFALPFPEVTRDRLVNEVLQGGTSPAYEWTQQWLEYVEDPTAEKRNVIKMKLDGLFTYMFRMAEFQLG